MAVDAAASPTGGGLKTSASAPTLPSLYSARGEDGEKEVHSARKGILQADYFFARSLYRPIETPTIRSHRLPPVDVSEPMAATEGAPAEEGAPGMAKSMSLPKIKRAPPPEAAPVKKGEFQAPIVILKKSQMGMRPLHAG